MIGQFQSASRTAFRPTSSWKPERGGFLKSECPCSGSKDQCDTCRKDLERREEPQVHEPTSFASQRLGHSFGAIALQNESRSYSSGIGLGKGEAAFGVCDTDEGKCENGSAAPAPAPGAPAPAPAAPAVAPIVHTEPNLTWPAAGYTSAAGGGSSTTVERDFNVTYRAMEDVPNNIWRLDVVSGTGGVDIVVNTGGSRNPITNPPTTEAEAQEAVTVMKGYYARGGRGDWHTEAASRAHEEHHYNEWKCTADDYWRTARWRANQLTAPRATNANEAAAIATMRAGATGADAIMQALKTVCHTYWFTLPDNASSRPYAAGQAVLNNAVSSVQTLAAANGWTVEQGTSTPSSANPCFLPKALWP